MDSEKEKETMVQKTENSVSLPDIQYYVTVYRKYSSIH